MDYQFDHVAIVVEDLDRSRAFYEDLGGRVVSKKSPHFLEIKLGEARLHIIPRQGATRHDGVIDHLCLSVKTLQDLEALARKLNQSPLLAEYGPFEIQDSPPLDEGFKDHVEERPPRRTLYFRDPDGISIEIRAYS